MMYAPICTKRCWWTMTNDQLHADNRRRAVEATRVKNLHESASRGFCQFDGRTPWNRAGI